MAATIEERIAKQQAELERLEALKVKQEGALGEAEERLGLSRDNVDALLDTVEDAPSIGNAKALREAVADYVIVARKLAKLKM